MKIRAADISDQEELVQLIAEFRVTLVRLRGKNCSINIEAAKKELAEYQSENHPIFVAENEGSKIIGYLVCRLNGDVVWAESLFVLPEHRRKGIGSALYSEAERVAQEVGGETLYNWIHPNNDKIISFLQNRGYDVLNLIELRRPRPAEESTQKIRVGKNEFNY